MTEIRTGGAGPKPTLRVERTQSIERVEVSCPEGSSLSIQDSFISCVPNRPSPQRPPDILPAPALRPPDLDRPMALPSLADNAIKVADEARRGGYHSSVRSTLSAVIPKLSQPEDLIKVAGFASTYGYSSQVSEAASALVERRPSARQALAAADLMRKGGHHGPVRTVLSGAIAQARRFEDLVDLASFASTYGYSSQVSEAASAIARDRLSARQALTAADLMRRGGHHGAVRTVLDRAIMTVGSNQEATELGNWAKTYGYSSQTNAAYARATELMLQGR